jgi:hypothetical protein
MSIIIVLKLDNLQLHHKFQKDVLQLKKEIVQLKDANQQLQHELQKGVTQVMVEVYRYKRVGHFYMVIIMIALC